MNNEKCRDSAKNFKDLIRRRCRFDTEIEEENVKLRIKETVRMKIGWEREREREKEIAQEGRK